MIEKKKNNILGLDQLLIEIINKENPITVKQLVRSAKSKTEISEQEIFERISALQNCGKLKLKHNLSESLSIKNYLLSGQAYWYQITIALAGTTTALILANVENLFLIGNFLVYIRYILGLIFVLFLPGYSLMRSLFLEKKNEPFELVALSIGLSLMIIALNAMILNFTPMGLSTNSITLTILIITIVLSTIAVTREYKISNVS